MLPRTKPIVGLDKVAHMCMYAGFAYLCIWGYRRQYQENDDNYRKKAIILACLISVIYGGLTELMQENLVPSRTGSWYDFLADAIGTILGISFFCLFFRKKK